MTNEEIVEEIKNGKDDYISMLWAAVEKFICVQANKFYAYYRARCMQIGVEVEDLVQVSFFALKSAITAYKGEYKFLTYLSYHLQTQFRSVCKMRSLGWRNNPVYQTISLDNILNDETDQTFISLLPAAGDLIEDFIKSDWQNHLHKDMTIAFEMLTPRQQEVLDGLYRRNLTFTQLAGELGVKKASVFNVKKSALNRLAKSEVLKIYLNQMKGVL